MIDFVDLVCPNSDALKVYLGYGFFNKAAKFGIYLDDMSTCWPSLLIFGLNFDLRSSAFYSIIVFSVKHSLMEDTIFPNKD